MVLQGSELILTSSLATLFRPDTLKQQDLLRHTSFIIPTYNASPHWNRLRVALDRQGVRPDQVLVIDSSSSDNTRELVRWAGYRLREIPKESFRHGTTRQMAVESLPESEVLVFLTQDALPCGKDSIEKLLRAFHDPDVGAAYGRQLPREEADAIERHARMFNYSGCSEIRTFASRERLGMKTIFFSNSFAAYRRAALEDAGGFPSDAIVSEEVTVVARMLVAGWKIAYQADATAIHSHSLTVRREFSRYFDIGVHRGRERWLQECFGGAGGEGLAFVASEMRFLMKTSPSLIPLAMLRNLSKWCSYELGFYEKYLPLWLKSSLSSQQDFWREQPVKSAMRRTTARSLSQVS
jgi:rhamnosyltransferase